VDTTGIVVRFINVQAGPRAIVGINGDGGGECVDDIGDGSFCIDRLVVMARKTKKESIDIPLVQSGSETPL
jgi:hypothetical protein